MDCAPVPGLDGDGEARVAIVGEVAKVATGKDGK